MRAVKRWVSKGAGNREGEYTELVEPWDAKAVPKQKLLSIVGLLGAIAGISEGRVTVPELADALTRIYDPDTMMVYDASGIGLASPIDGGTLGPVSGFNKRADLVADIFNSGYWDERRSGMVNGAPVAALCVLKPDAVELARSLWEFFFPREGDYPGVDHLLATQTTGPKSETSSCVGELPKVEPDSNKSPGQHEKDGERKLSTRERNTLLTIIAALCKEAKLDPAKPAKTAGYLRGIMAEMGVDVGESTIESHLKKIPEALQSRST